MKRYSIQDIENLTGIKKHTLRIWEQRYDFLVPHRTETNIRYYDEEQLRQLLNVSLLLGSGYRISQLTKLSRDDINKEITKSYEAVKSHPDQEIEFVIKELIEAMIELSETRFEKQFTTSLIKRGLEKTITDVIFPFVERMGMMWRTGDISTAQEHFMYFLIRQKIIVSIDSLAIAPENAATFLVFLPESDFDDLFILLSIYLIKYRGNKIINLGQNVSIRDLKPLVEQTNPEVLLTFLTPQTNFKNLQGYVDDLKKTFPQSEIIISGRNEILKEIEFPPRIESISSLEDLNDYLAK